MTTFKQFLENQAQQNPSKEWYEKPLPLSLKAYHGGSNFDKFDLNHLGEGEYTSTNRIMFPDLGFGIYFSDCKYIAALYTKHAKDPAIHEVILNTQNLYDRRNGHPLLNQKLEDILKELNKNKKDEPFNTFGIYDGLFRIMGKYQAIDILTKYGIDGEFTRLPSGCYEISVINLDIIKKIGVEYPIQKN